MRSNLGKEVKISTLKYSFIILEYDNSFQISQMIQALEVGIIHCLIVSENLVYGTTDRNFPII